MQKRPMVPSMYRTGQDERLYGGACPPSDSRTALNDCAAVKAFCRTYFASQKVAAVPSLGFADIEIDVQKPFQASQVVIPSKIAEFFDILSFTVGVDPQIVANGTASAQVFSEVAVRSWMMLDPAFSGTNIGMRVQNVDAVARDFYVSFFGHAVK